LVLNSVQIKLTFSYHKKKKSTKGAQIEDMVTEYKLNES